MIRLRVRGLRRPPVELGPTALFSARDAREMEGERDRSIGVRWDDMTDEGRDEPPSLTPPPRTVTFPPSYGVMVGVVDDAGAGVAPVTVAGVVESLCSACGVPGEGVRPRGLVTVSADRLWVISKISAEPGRDPGVIS